MWQLRCAFIVPYLLAVMASVLPFVPTSDSLLQGAFQVQPTVSADGSDQGWNLPPKPNSTHHLIFNSISGLLQRWPNTLYRNGGLDFHLSHTIM